MVMTERSHPDPQLLAAYELALLSPAVMAEIEAHLLGCEGCCVVLEERIDHSFLAKVRKAGQTPAGGWTASWTPRDSDAPATPATAATHGDGVPPDARPALWEALADHPRYVIRGVIGEGGMGVVFLAEHRLMGRPVALKAIKGSLRGDATIQSRFQREVRANAQLSHPNIAAAHDAEQVGGVCFLVMEYVEGEDLGQRLDRLGRLPVTQACGFARQAALGLDHAHRKGMVHRDVKPHNLRVKPDGSLKLLDFGLARVLHEAYQGATLTQALALMGTPDYVAPEQAFSPHAADGRADLYSLGCSLYHLLAGRPPFPGGTLQEKLERHLVGTPAPLRSLRDDVPAALEAVVARMMAKPVAERYQTAGDVAEALGPFVEEPRPQAEPRRGRRGWWPVALAAGVLFVAGLLGVVTYTIQTDKGELELKADLPKGAKVVISQDGDDVSILDGDKVVVRLKAGKYAARIEGADGWELEAKEYVLKRGGKEAVKATWKPAPEKEVTPPAVELPDWFVETPVSGQTKFNEGDPQVAIDAKGRFVVVWHTREGDHTIIYGRLFEKGEPAGPPFHVANVPTGNQSYAKVAMTSDGRFVVAWSRLGPNNQGIFARRFTATGKPLGDEFQVNSTPAVMPLASAVVMTAKGDFIVAYVLSRPGGPALPFVQRFDASGGKVGGEVRVGKRGHVDHETRMAIAPDGQFAIAYDQGHALLIQRFSADGTPAGKEVRVNSVRETVPWLGNLAFDAKRRLIVFWCEKSNDGSVKVYLRRYDAEWKACDDKEMLIGEGLTTNCYPTIARRAAGDGFAIWLDRYPGKRRVVARYIDPSGQPYGANVPVSYPTLKDQIAPAVAVNDEGCVVVSWGEGTPEGNYFNQVRGFKFPANPR